jgi:hypothetical protein
VAGERFDAGLHLAPEARRHPTGENDRTDAPVRDGVPPARFEHLPRIAAPRGEGHYILFLRYLDVGTLDSIVISRRPSRAHTVLQGSKRRQVEIVPLKRIERSLVEYELSHSKRNHDREAPVDPLSSRLVPMLLWPYPNVRPQ